MRCAWQSVLDIIPFGIREKVDALGRGELLELRLRVKELPELVIMDKILYLDKPATVSDLEYCVNIASEYSPWVAQTAGNGYITAPGGHRIGLCGRAIIKSNVMLGVRNLTSLCIRVARDHPGIASRAAELDGSILILGKPGSGKTTLLRDLIRCRSRTRNDTIAVVDEREEIFPKVHDQFCFPIGKRVDILSGCDKKTGINSLLRSMSPDVIAIDEVTAKEDCEALISAGWCGVDLIATAHADSVEALKKRPVYKPLFDSEIFETVIQMQPDKSWTIERLYS